MLKYDNRIHINHMPLIKSISGIRGTIGGAPGDNLTPVEIVNFTIAYARLLSLRSPGAKIKIIIGRDGRISGEMVRSLVIGALLSRGVNVVDLGIVATPTVELAVVSQSAQGGIILTASHNPAGWNALKLLNEQGEYLNKEEGARVIDLSEEKAEDFLSEDRLGSYIFNPSLDKEHYQKILALPLVDPEAIRQKKFKIVVDGINTVGGRVVPELLERLGVAPENLILLNCEVDGHFAHKPEPLAENLTQIMERVKETKADLGIVVDPDVDRLAFIDENGAMIGEEYTLVAIADYVLANFDTLEALEPGRYKKATVSNLSSSRALKDVTEGHGGTYEAAAVGEVNVVAKMRETRAVIGGEGNGGVIFPILHIGRDALVGIALFLTHLAKSGQKVSELRRALPDYFMVKDRIDLTPDINLLEILEKIKHEYQSEKITDIDGVKIDWLDSWVHLRGSTTEPIIRIYAEAKTLDLAAQRVKEIKDKILAYIE
jgi:phosphomannomutase